MKRLLAAAVSALALTASIATTQAMHIYGTVSCPSGLVFSNVTVNIVGTNCDGAVSTTATTDINGSYYASLTFCDGVYLVSLDPATLPSDAIVSPAGPVVVTLNSVNYAQLLDFSIQSSVCDGGACWLTGGGAKVDPLLEIPVAHAKGKSTLKTPDIAFGGNVNPGCSALAGDGGSWNHVDRTKKLHFHGQAITVVDCGNVAPPVPPGSTSPVTPYNFIEFTGTGTLKGISGNKADYGTVYFFARCEDRNEPGSNGANDGSLVDRYYLRVYTNPADPMGSTVLQLGGNDADPANNVVPITDGNLQLHRRPCP